MDDALWTVGFHAVLAVLESDQPVDLLWLQRDRRDRRIQRIRTAARNRGIRYDLVSRARLEQVADGAAHNGCAVRSAPVAFVELEDLVEPENEPSRLLLVDGLSDPHNLGAVLRTAAALARRRLENDPKDGEARRVLGKALFAEGDLHAAERELREDLAPLGAEVEARLSRVVASV